jgi:hypothetical protein
MSQQFYKIVTKSLPKLAKQFRKDFARYAISKRASGPQSPDVLEAFPVDEHSMLYIMLDYSMVYTKTVVPTQPVNLIPQKYLNAAMMVNPPFSIDLGESLYEHAEDGTFSTMGVFGKEPARFIFGPNEELVFELYRQLNAGLVKPGRHRHPPAQPPHTKH